MQNNKLNIKQSGFTVLELTLAMTFLAFILMFSATVVVQLSNNYVKGLTVKEINQAGRSLTDDLARTLQSSVSSQINAQLVDGGLLCVGQVAYIWNPVYVGGSFNSSGISAPHRLSGQPISLARTTSQSIGNCTDPGQKSIPNSVSSTMLLSDSARILSAEVNRSLTDPKLVNIKFVIGTFASAEATHLATGNFTNVYNSAYLSDGDFTCRESRYGNFCAYSEFNTTVYVTR